MLAVLRLACSASSILVRDEAICDCRMRLCLRIRGITAKRQLVLMTVAVRK